MKLTVAVCAHNPDDASFQRALQSIAKQIGETQGSEFLVVDNNSSPPLAARGYIGRLGARIIDEKTPGLTAAREAAFAEARGELLIFVDDDNVLGDGYLEGAVQLFEENPRLALASGAVVPEYETTPPDWFAPFESSLAIRRYDRNVRVFTERPPWTEHFPIGAGMIVRRSVAIAYAADCAKTARIEGRRGDALSSGEDLDLGLFALSQGHCLLVTGELRLTHIIPEARTQEEYLRRLIAGQVRSAQALEAKWAPRFSMPIIEFLRPKLAVLIAQLVVTSALAPFSPRQRVRQTMFTEILRLRRMTTRNASE